MSDDSTASGGPFEGGQVAVTMGAGVAAWLVTYLFTYAVAGTDVQNNPLRQLAEIPTWKGVGYVFYNTHFVDVIVNLPLFGGQAVSFVGGEDGFTAALYLLPPVILTIAGIAVGRASGVETASPASGAETASPASGAETASPASGAETASPASAAAAGGAVTLGYVVPCVVGLFVFDSTVVSIVPATGVFVAGVVYPLLFGGVGAVVAHFVGGLS